MARWTREGDEGELSAVRQYRQRGFGRGIPAHEIRAGLEISATGDFSTFGRFRFSQGLLLLSHDEAHGSLIVDYDSVRERLGSRAMKGISQ